MIVVIAIIGVLVAILIPALSGVQARSKKLKEINLLSHVIKAWVMYSGEHQDKLLPGYISTDVQKYRKLAWAFEDTSLISPAPTYEPTIPNEVGPWTWRLLSYLDYDWRSLLFYRDTSEWTSEEIREHAEVIATEPAFGYNGFYLGGWWNMDGHSGKPTVIFGSVQLTDGRRTNVVSKMSSSIKKPSKQITFCSTFFARIGVYKELEDSTPGSHFAIPSVLARVKRWTIKPDGRVEARFATYIPLGRFNGMPAVGFADGSVRSVELVDLVDQSLWIPKAEPVGDFPASNFSHTMH